MNHWVSKLEEDKERCSACSQPVPNSSGVGGVQITGSCAGVTSQSLIGGLAILCSQCVQRPPWLGKYKLVELALPHHGFCHQCRAFVGDGYYLVDLDPLGGVQVKLSAKTKASLWGIWCTHATRPPRWVPHEDPLVEMPKPFGSEGDAAEWIEHQKFEKPNRPSLSYPATFWLDEPGWTATPKRLGS